VPMTSVLETAILGESVADDSPKAFRDGSGRSDRLSSSLLTQSVAGGYTVPAHRVREFARLSARHGWDARAALAAAGITPTSLNQPCPDVTLEKAVAVLRHLWLDTVDEFLGLGPRPVCRHTLRVLALAVCSAPTLRDALDRAEQFMPVFPGIPLISVSIAASETTVSVGLHDFDGANSLVVDSMLAVAHRAMNWATRRRLQLLRVTVPYQRPFGEIDHDILFGAPVRFGASGASLTFANSDLTLPLVRRQEEIEEFLADVPTVLVSEIDFYTTHTQRVRGIILRCLGERACTADEIAACFGISRQTLRRRLREEGTSVTAIRDDVLRTAALESLSQGGETVAALAARLGFSEPSAFTRAFRRWTGASPTDFQRSQPSKVSYLYLPLARRREG